MCCRAQTLQGKVAQAPSGYEIRDLLKEVQQLVLANKEWPAGRDPVWSLDNAAVHRWALEMPDWSKAGGWFRTNMRGNVWLPPPYSPDLHQVVEHAIANLCTQFNKLLWDEVEQHTSARPTVHGYAALIQQAFRTACNQQAINHNVMRLPHVYDSVRSAKGEWAEKNLR